MQKIYWSKYNIFNNSSMQTMEYSPYNIIKEFSKNKPIREDVNWIGCPATKDFLKNTFAFKNPLDLHMQINSNNTVFWPNNNLEELISIRQFDEKSIVLDYLMPITLFSKEDIIATMTSPFLSRINNSMSHLIPGQFNISKWFRPMMPSFMIYDLDIDFSINKGDDIYYIKFNTPKKIELVEFYFTDTLRDIVSNSLELKRFKKNIGLDTLYDIFNSQKIDKIIMKEIEKATL